MKISDCGKRFSSEKICDSLTSGLRWLGWIKILLPRINCIILSSHKLPVICIHLFRITSDNRYASGSCNAGFSGRLQCPLWFNNSMDARIRKTRHNLLWWLICLFFVIFRWKQWQWWLKECLWQNMLKFVLIGTVIYSVTCVLVNH